MEDAAVMMNPVKTPLSIPVTVAWFCYRTIHGAETNVNSGTKQFVRDGIRYMSVLVKVGYKLIKVDVYSEHRDLKLKEV